MRPDPLAGPPLRVGPIFDVLARTGVDFVVVGGLAGNAQGSTYPTFDLDVAYARDHQNLKRMATALKELVVTLTSAPKDLAFQIDAETLYNGSNFTFDTEFGRFDILGHIPGIKSYDELRAASELAELEGHEVRVASLDHLIAMKRASNRSKDRVMFEEYIVIADERGQQH